MDMSLDDIIAKKSRDSGGRSSRGGRGNRRGSGGVTRGRSSGFRGYGTGARSNSVPSGRWNHDMYQGDGRMPPPLMSVETTGPVKIHISNLDYQVTDSDIRELFREFGDIVVANVHYDSNRCSMGTAQVIYREKNAALRAISTYNGVHLDQRPMHITLEGNRKYANNAPSRPMVKRLNQNFGGGNRPSRGRSQAVGRGRGRGGKPSESKPKTAEELDAELDKYIREAKSK